MTFDQEKGSKQRMASRNPARHEDERAAGQRLPSARTQKSFPPELGIEATFWSEKQSESKSQDVIQFPGVG